jgi:hypothetical protein
MVQWLQLRLLRLTSCFAYLIPDGERGEEGDWNSYEELVTTCVSKTFLTFDFRDAVSVSYFCQPALAIFLGFVLPILPMPLVST